MEEFAQKQVMAQVVKEIAVAAWSEEQKSADIEVAVAEWSDGHESRKIGGEKIKGAAVARRTAARRGSFRS